MNVFLNPRNGASLTNMIDVTAHSISLFQENGQPKNTNGTLIPRNDISIAEPIDAQIDQLGNNIITMYQLIGITNDEKVPGLESILNHMNNDPAINEHHYHITIKKKKTTKKHITYTNR